ncbi:MAG: hypothetical protein ACK500_11130, partial [Flavobacteriales bacterium]
TWDNTNLYVGIGPTSNNTNEPFVLYIDMDPIVPVNGGSNANGATNGFNNYNRCTYNQPFRADFVLFWREGTSPYHEFRTDNGTGGWGAQTANTFTRAQSGSGANNGQEIAIPWSAITGAGRPASFNWHSHKIYDNSASNNGIYGQLPAENPGGAQNVAAYTLQAVRYYTVSTTTIGSSTPPMSRNSYTHPFGVTNNSFGAISVWDFTMNSASQQIARTTGNWTINGNLVVANGSLFFGSFGGPYGSTTVANVRVMGGQLDMDLSDQPMAVTGNVQTEPGGTIVESDTPGGDINVAGNFTHSGGYVANGRELRFNGTGVQTLSGTGTMILGNVVINNPTSVLLEGTLVVSGTLTLTNGILQLGNTTESFLSTTFPISGANASRYLRTTNGWLTQFVGPGFPGVFPVGVSAYNPITIEDVANFQSVFIRAIDGTVPGTLNNKTVNRYWRITTNDVTPLQISVNAQWNSGEESAGFTAGTVPYIGYFDGSSWSQVSATQTGSGPFQFSGGNFSEGPVTFTDFDYIALGKDNAFLPAPDITVTPTSLGFGFVASGGTSAQQPFNVSASNLSPASGNITVTPPANFEVSLTSGGPYSATAITIPYTGGNLSSTPVYVVFKPTGPPASYSANIAVSGGGAPSENAAVTGNSLPQVFQSFDTFDRANNAVIGIPSSGGAASWVEVEAGGSCTPSSTIIRIDNNQLELSNCNDGGTGSCGGSQYKAAMFDMTGKYATTYAQSGGVMEWYFNMKQSRPSPSGLSGTTYGVAYILGCNETTPGSGTADGYMVSMGDGGGTDPIRLMYFTNGMPAFDVTTMDGQTICSTASPTTKTNYMSIKVTYDPCSNQWSLLVRDDGTSAFSDPTTITGTPATGANSTYVNTSLIYSGAFWKHSSSCEEIAIFDNISIPNSSSVSSTYTWNGSISTDYQVAGNWTPSRDCPRVNDVLQFNSVISPATSTVTNVPNQTIAQMLISGNRVVILSDVASDVAASTLTLHGGTGVDLSVESGSSLILDVASSNNGADAVILSLNTGSTASISGNFTFRNSNTGTLGRP